MQRPLVSVLMTSYNRDKYISEAIESVIASSYQNWELIIVDDCSTDRTVEIARSYEAKDSRIKTYINEKNLGDYPNRNRAASYAKGKYLKYVDADDLVYSHGIEVMVNMMERFPEAGLGIGSLLSDYYKIFPICLSPEEAYRRHYFSTPFLHKSPLSTIINREAFLKIGGFSGKRMVGDFEMWFKMAAILPVVLMPHGLVWYRRHNEQEMSDFRKNSFFPFSYSIIEMETLKRKDCPLDDKDKKKIISKIKKRQIRNILKGNIFSKTTWKMINHSFLFNKDFKIS